MSLLSVLALSQLLANNLACIRKVPADITVWNWLFDSKHSILNTTPSREVRGYTNAITKERVSYAQVKGYTIYLSTALVKKYGLQPTQTVALFGQNTIWYPVAMLGTLRAGMESSYEDREIKYPVNSRDADAPCP